VTASGPSTELLAKRPGDVRTSTGDAEDLARLGYATQFLRAMGGFSNFAISFSIISILTGAVTLFDYGLSMGGPREMTLGWPIATVATLFVALSMAELCSALPTSGGMYHWSAELGGPLWAWFTAWLNIVGLIAAMAGIDYGCAQFLLPTLGFESRATSLFLVYGIILLSQTLVNQYSARLVARLNDLSAVVHIVGVIVLIGALLAFAPKQPIQFLWSTTHLSPIHSPYAWLFVLGLLQAQWTYTGFDASAHVAEETIDPRRRAPWGMVTSVAVSGIFGYLLILSLTWAIPDVRRVLTARDSGGNAIPAVFTIVRTSLGDRAVGAVLGLTILAMWFCGLAALTSVSRIIFALARDNGMPLSSLWRKVSDRRKTPGHAIWLSSTLALAAMMYSRAYSVVTSISVIGFYLSYIIPVYLGWINKRSWVSKRGPWHLGKWSNLINLLAIIWGVFICAVMVMPPNARAGLAIIGVMAILLIFRVVGKRHEVHKPHW
jgi:amino acid transporter